MSGRYCGQGNMSYLGYTRTFHDYDGRTRTVIKEPVKPESIRIWITGTKQLTKRRSQFTNTECPKCGRNTTGALSHTCP